MNIEEPCHALERIQKEETKNNRARRTRAQIIKSEKTHVLPLNIYIGG